MKAKTLSHIGWLVALLLLVAGAVHAQVRPRFWADNMTPLNMTPLGTSQRVWVLHDRQQSDLCALVIEVSSADRHIAVSSQNWLCR